MPGNVKHYRLIGADGKPYRTTVKGALGGHRGSKIFGRLDCPAASRAIARGGYVTHRVLFADAATAAQAGYRPCAVCMRDAYRAWKATSVTTKKPSSATARDRHTPKRLAAPSLALGRTEVDGSQRVFLP